MVFEATIWYSRREVRSWTEYEERVELMACSARFDGAKMVRSGALSV